MDKLTDCLGEATATLNILDQALTVTAQPLVTQTVCVDANKATVFTKIPVVVNLGGLDTAAKVDTVSDPSQLCTEDQLLRNVGLNGAGTYYFTCTLAADVAEKTITFTATTKDGGRCRSTAYVGTHADE